MKILCVTLHFVLMNKTNLRYTLHHTPVQQQSKLDGMTGDSVQRDTRRYDWPCVGHVAAISSGVQCRQFLDKNFKRY
jgi:hypothetical protein